MVDLTHPPIDLAERFGGLTGPNFRLRTPRRPTTSGDNRLAGMADKRMY